MIAIKDGYVNINKFKCLHTYDFKFYMTNVLEVTITKHRCQKCITVYGVGSIWFTWGHELVRKWHNSMYFEAYVVIPWYTCKRADYALLFMTQLIKVSMLRGIWLALKRQIHVVYLLYLTLTQRLQHTEHNNTLSVNAHEKLNIFFITYYNMCISLCLYKMFMHK